MYMYLFIYLSIYLYIYIYIYASLNQNLILNRNADTRVARPRAHQQVGSPGTPPSTTLQNLS